MSRVVLPKSVKNIQNLQKSQSKGVQRSDVNIQSAARTNFPTKKLNLEVNPFFQQSIAQDDKNLFSADWSKGSKSRMFSADRLNVFTPEPARYNEVEVLSPKQRRNILTPLSSLKKPINFQVGQKNFDQKKLKNILKGVDFNTLSATAEIKASINLRRSFLPNAQKFRTQVATAQASYDISEESSDEQPESRRLLEQIKSPKPLELPKSTLDAPIRQLRSPLAQPRGQIKIAKDPSSPSYMKYSKLAVNQGSDAVKTFSFKPISRQMPSYDFSIDKTQNLSMMGNKINKLTSYDFSLDKTQTIDKTIDASDDEDVNLMSEFVDSWVEERQQSPQSKNERVKFSNIQAMIKNSVQIKPTPKLLSLGSINEKDVNLNLLTTPNKKTNFKKIQKQLDLLMYLADESKQKSLLNKQSLQEALKNYKASANIKIAESDEMKKLIESYQQLLSIDEIKKLKEMTKDLDYAQRNQVLMEMIQEQHDQGFQKLVDNAKPEIRAHLNFLMQGEQPAKPMKMVKRELSPMSHLIQNQRLNRINTLEVNTLSPNTKSRLLRVKVTKKSEKNISEKKSQESSDEQSEYEYVNEKKQTRKMGPAAQKFRVFVQKHFLSKTLEQLENQPYNEIPMGFFILMDTLKDCLDLMLQKQYCDRRHNNLGLKYDSLDLNLYENKFLQNLLCDIPAFKGSINLKNKKPVNLPGVNKVTVSNQITAEHIVKTTTSSADTSPDGQFSLNQLFHSQNDKFKFYNGGKLRHLNPKDSQDIEKFAMKKYCERCQASNIVIQPFFLSFEHNTLYLSQNHIDTVHGEALQEFLINVKQVPHRRIYKLIVDECMMKDEVFALLLEGIYQQCTFLNDQIDVQYLTTVSYSNNEFGEKSLTILNKLIPRLTSISFNNLSQFKGCEKLTYSLTQNKSLLMKLRLSNVNLNSKETVDNLCQVICKTKVLQLVNFSWSSLSPSNLTRLCDCLPERLLSLRSIDFSYNRLNFDTDYDNSYSFVQSLMDFLSKSILVNHLKISGMGFRKNELLQLAEKIASCPLLMSVHLSDNEITRDYQLLNEILNLFNMGETDLHEVNRSQVHQTFLNPQKAGYSKCEYGLKIKKLQSQNNSRIILKDQILMNKQQKIMDNFKAINNSQFNEGVGRMSDNQFDQLVFTRIVNYPELIFNQKISNDAKIKTRFFMKDASQQWALSRSNECILCDKHKYTIIFYERSAKNADLVEIKDQSFLQQIRDDYIQNYATYQTQTPIIFGSIVKKPFGQNNFVRKLKMIRAPLYTLMCISGSAHFIQSKKQTQTLKQAALRFLELDKNNVLEQLSITEKLYGWPQVLDDKCHRNELTDVQTINGPNFQKDITNKNIYVYSAFLHPGYHQVIIYDPKTQQAFFKDFILGMNSKDFYPEYPILQDPFKHTKIVQDVWRNWLVDTEKDLDWSFDLDICSDTFIPQNFIKQEDDLKECLNIMRSHMEMIKIYHIELITHSDKYPQASWERIWGELEWVHENTDLPKAKQLFQGQVELQFISATRFDDTAGLRSAMQRQELIEFIMRLAKAWVVQRFGAKKYCHIHLAEFIQMYVKPIYDRSTILEIRNSMRKNPRLNELLFDNLKALQELYDKAKLPKVGFTLEAAQKFFLSFEEVKDKISLDKIEECFVFSMMTVLNEQASLKKYEYIVFVEFLDMLCRVAYCISQYQDTIDYKVFVLLEIIFNQKYEEGVWTEETHPLHEINLDVEINN